MADLAAFLSDRYTEAEAGARNLLRTAQDVRLALTEPRLLGRVIPGWHSWADVEAMCNSRLADIAIKRTILTLHKPDGNPADEWYGSSVGCTSCGGYIIVAGLGDRGYQTRWPCPTVRQLATEFGDHPEYKAGE